MTFIQILNTRAGKSAVAHRRQPKHRSVRKQMQQQQCVLRFLQVDFKERDYKM